MKQDLAKALRRGAMTLESAIFSGQIASRALHAFACDCAARAILNEELQYRDVPSFLVKAIATKRDWIDEMCQLEVMEKARQKALASLRDLKSQRRWRGYSWMSSFSYHGTDGLSGGHVVQAAVWAIAMDGEDAAENAAKESCEALVYARGVTRAQEQAWQRRRLAFLHELSSLTRRMWLALEDDQILPVERPANVALDAFDA